MISRHIKVNMGGGDVNNISIAPINSHRKKEIFFVQRAKVPVKILLFIKAWSKIISCANAISGLLIF